MNTAEKQKLQALINVLIEQELHEEQQILEEGMADVFKASWEKTKGVASQGWDAIKAQFSNSSKKILGEIQKILGSIKSSFPALKAEYDAVIQAGQQAGAPIKLIGPLQEAAALAKEAQAVYANVVADAEQTKQLATQAAKQQTKQEAIRFQDLSSMMLETANKIQPSKTELIKEGGVLPTVLAGFGGTMLILKWSAKFFTKFQNPTAAAIAEKLHSAYEGMHHIEDAVLRTIFPDKASYYFYAGQSKLRKKQPIPFEQYANSDTAAKTRKYMYMACLLFLLLQGIYHLFNAGWQALNATVAATETTHAVEIGGAAIEVSQALRAGGAAAAGAATNIADMGDIVSSAVDMVADAGENVIGNAATTAAQTPQ